MKKYPIFHRSMIDCGPNFAIHTCMLRQKYQKVVVYANNGIPFEIWEPHLVNPPSP